VRLRRLDPWRTRASGLIAGGPTVFPRRPLDCEAGQLRRGRPWVRVPGIQEDRVIDFRLVANVAQTYNAAAGLRDLCEQQLGYVKIDPRGAELLFQIITEREERASIAIATNLPFSEWGTVFPDPRLVAAIVDRVTFNAHILETGTQSYRLRTSKNTSSRKRAS
jgi:DNA replication protein